MQTRGVSLCSLCSVLGVVFYPELSFWLFESHGARSKSSSGPQNRAVRRAPCVGCSSRALVRLCETAGTGLAPDLGRREAESAGEGHACGVPHNGGGCGGECWDGACPWFRDAGTERVLGRGTPVVFPIMGVEWWEWGMPVVSTVGGAGSWL